MTHEQHVHLIKKGIRKKAGIWADFGSGDGAFTLALRDVAGEKVEIYSVDRDGGRLKTQKNEFDKHFPQTNIHFFLEDFTTPLPLSPLDGIIMANSLHYVKEQKKFLLFLQKYLKPEGVVVLVEYNIDTPNPWIPYPLSFASFKRLAEESNFTTVKLLEKVPSSYWEEMYSAVAQRD